MKILITGATGFVGNALSKKLLAQGHELHILTRNKSKLSSFFQHPKITAFEWSDFSKLPPAESVSGINGVINLMGESIAAKKWTAQQKIELRNSRVEATRNLVNLIDQNLSSSLDFFISSSAIGIYPVNLDKTLTEESSVGRNFLAKLCLEWEEAANSLKKVNRLVIIRTGVVLEQHGGALAKMILPFKLGLGGPIGDGNHYMSWIHLDDLVALYVKAVEDNSFKGVYNGVAPLPVNNFDFTKALGSALHRPTIFPVPSTVLKLAFGEMSSVILDSQKVVSKKLEDQHFQFQYQNIETALNKIFEKH